MPFRLSWKTSALLMAVIPTVYSQCEVKSGFLDYSEFCKRTKEMEICERFFVFCQWVGERPVEPCSVKPGMEDFSQFCKLYGGSAELCVSVKDYCIWNNFENSTDDSDEAKNKICTERESLYILSSNELTYRTPDGVEQVCTSFENAIGGVFDGEGNVYVIDNVANAVFFVEKGCGEKKIIISKIDAPYLQGPVSIALKEGDEKIVYVAIEENDVVNEDDFFNNAQVFGFKVKDGGWTGGTVLLESDDYINYLAYDDASDALWGIKDGKDIVKWNKNKWESYSNTPSSVYLDGFSIEPDCDKYYLVSSEANQVLECTDLEDISNCTLTCDSTIGGARTVVLGEDCSPIAGGTGISHFDEYNCGVASQWSDRQNVVTLLSFRDEKLTEVPCSMKTKAQCTANKKCEVAELTCEKYECPEGTRRSKKTVCGGKNKNECGNCCVPLYCEDDAPKCRDDFFKFGDKECEDGDIENCPRICLDNECRNCCVDKDSQPDPELALVTEAEDGDEDGDGDGDGSGEDEDEDFKPGDKKCDTAQCEKGFVKNGDVNCEDAKCSNCCDSSLLGDEDEDRKCDTAQCSEGWVKNGNLFCENKKCANCCSRNGQASTEEAGQGSIENNNLKCDITQCEEGWVKTGDTFCSSSNCENCCMKNRNVGGPSCETVTCDSAMFRTGDTACKTETDCANCCSMNRYDPETTDGNINSTDGSPTVSEGNDSEKCENVKCDKEGLLKTRATYCKGTDCSNCCVRKSCSKDMCIDEEPTGELYCDEDDGCGNCCGEKRELCSKNFDCGDDYLTIANQYCRSDECTLNFCCKKSTCLTNNVQCYDTAPDPKYASLECTGDACTDTLCCSGEPIKAASSLKLCGQYNHSFETPPDGSFETFADDDLVKDAKWDGIDYSIVYKGTFQPIPGRYVQIEESGGKLDEAETAYKSQCNGGAADSVRNSSQVDFEKYLMRYLHNDFEEFPSLLITYNCDGSSQAAGILYDIDGEGSKEDRQEQLIATAYDKDYKFIASDYSWRGNSSDCDTNPLEGDGWTFVLDNEDKDVIKFVRIDYIGTGTVRAAGVGFDHFYPFGCTSDTRVEKNCA